MSLATIAILTQDPQLAESVRSTLMSINHCRTLTLHEPGPLLDRRNGDLPALVVLHLAGTVDRSIAVEFLRAFRRQGQPPPLLAITDRQDPELALALIKAGVVDCLSRPLNLSRLTMLAEMLTAPARLRGCAAEPNHVPPRIQQLGTDVPFLFGSDVMQRLLSHVQRVASQDVNILLTGETGTGKTRLAQLIHELSDRKQHPFLVVNCGTLSDTLTESELFGHCRGAFTSADRNRVGKLAAVGRGTLLLDDVDALSPCSQAKLLRALDERMFEPVGSNESQEVRARFIVASNRALEREVEAGRFRADLYFRLNVVHFHLPPLRERRSEIRALANHFVSALSQNSGQHVRIEPDALEALEHHPWPGNIRELRNVIERCLALRTDDVIRWDDLPDAVRIGSRALVSAEFPRPAAPLARTRGGEPSENASPPVDRAAASAALRPQRATDQNLTSMSVLASARIQAEIERIYAALAKHRNNRKRAADELGISRTALYKKLHKYGMMDTP